MPNSALFSTMSSWFGGFKHRYNFQSLQKLGEAPVQMRKLGRNFQQGYRKLKAIHGIKFLILMKQVSIINACFQVPIFERQENKPGF